MQKKYIPSLDTTVSRLGFGAMRMPKKGDEIDTESVKQMVDTAIREGLTYFDTAYVYHGQKSEGVLKECLVDRYPREAYTLADKIPLWVAESQEDIPKIFEEGVSPAWRRLSGFSAAARYECRTLGAGKRMEGQRISAGDEKAG